MSYNDKQKWLDGKKRILDILNSTNNIEERDKVPSEQEFNFENGYYAWVTAVFVDIRKSTEFFSNNKKTTTAKVIRSFMSEVVEILKDDPNIREIGIRGDCVYAIYTTSTHKEDLIIARKAFCVNTFMKMFNKLLEDKRIFPLKVGIGVSTDKELIVKTGRKGSGINNLVWIGKAVSYASKFSNIANKNQNDVIVFSDNFYNSMISQLKEENKTENVESWFTKKTDIKLGNYFSCNVVNLGFNRWIERGMKNE
jgi:class 3 adenylate cyclase